MSRAAALFARLMERPPCADRCFWCCVCRVELRGRSVTLDEDGRAFCGDCVGRVRPEE